MTVSLNMNTLFEDSTYHVFQCQETETGEKFRMKLIKTKNQKNAILYYAKLNPILKDRGVSYRFKMHAEIAISQNLDDYLKKLLSGQVCGLFHGGMEDDCLSIRMIKR